MTWRPFSGAFYLLTRVQLTSLSLVIWCQGNSRANHQGSSVLPKTIITYLALPCWWGDEWTKSVTSWWTQDRNSTKGSSRSSRQGGQYETDKYKSCGCRRKFKHNATYVFQLSAIDVVVTFKKYPRLNTMSKNVGKITGRVRRARKRQRKLVGLLKCLLTQARIIGLYTDESPGLKVDPVVVLVLSLGFIFSVVALHSMFLHRIFKNAAPDHAIVIAKLTRKFSS